MTTNSPAALVSAKKKLLTRIAGVQRQADAAKKTAKVAKLGLRAAKQKFKDAKRAAKKFRKSVKALKNELAALSAKKPARKKVAKKTGPKRVASVVAEISPGHDVAPVLTNPVPPADTTAPVQ